MAGISRFADGRRVPDGAHLTADESPRGWRERREPGPTFYAPLPADHASRADIPPGQPILLSAASFEALARHRGRPGALDVPKVPAQVPEIAVDPRWIRGSYVRRVPIFVG